MLDELNKHKVAYSILFFLLILHLGFFFALWPDKFSLRVVGASLSGSYFCWGVFAHVKAQHINRHIVREYLFSALLAGSMLFFLTL